MKDYVKRNAIERCKELLGVLKARFEKNVNGHRLKPGFLGDGLSWG